MGKSMQEALEEAFEEHEELQNEGTPAPAAHEGGATASNGEGATGEATSEGQQEQVPATGEQKPPKTPVEGAPQTGKAPAPSPAPAAQQVKAPVSWRPEVRGKFGSLPPEVQQEVVRREREVDQALRASSESRRFTDEFSRVISPYTAMLQAENAHPLAAVQSLMNTAYQLRTSDPQTKAQLVANLISYFRVDVNELDRALAASLGGQPQQQQQNPMLGYIQNELQPIKQFMAELGGMRQQQQRQLVQGAVDATSQFAADPQHEFFEDVRHDMADLLELAARRGVKMTLQDAYQRATMAHPTISRILAERAVAGQAQQRNNAARRSRAASASLPSGSAPEPGSGGASKPKDLHSAIEAAWDEVEEQGES